jgi:hypothetical protein
MKLIAVCLLGIFHLMNCFYFFVCLFCLLVCLLLFYDFVVVGFFLLLVCLQLHEQFFSYLAADTITGDRAANLDLCLALMAFSSEGSFTCHTYCATGPRFIRCHPKDRHHVPQWDSTPRRKDNQIHTLPL